MYTIEQRFVPAGIGIRAPKFVDSAKTIPLGGFIPMGMCWHWTANTRAGANADAHWTFWNRHFEGAHYAVDSTKILFCAPEDEVTYHTAGGVYATALARSKYPRGANLSLIGVEMCVNSDGDWAETYARAVWLGAVKCIEYG